ncbi:MAG: protein-L-isoaspartate O-methyltransferase [Spirochaetales bacterium]|nr:protein-L-isoaspartate O-methyltransferase [Spirochaetales bacterium]
MSGGHAGGASMDGARGLAGEVARAAPSYLGGSSRDPRVIEALARVDRAEFLPPAERPGAYVDAPIPIGGGQTCSQPSMVAFMVELLRLEPGHRVLEVGAGSGWATAIMAELVRPGGFTCACEILPGLAAALLDRFAARRDIGVVAGDGSLGLPELPPWDRIVLSAGVRRGFDPERLVRRLAPGGILLYPEAFGALIRITLDPRAPGDRRVESWEGVRFVPLQGAAS